MDFTLLEDAEFDTVQAAFEEIGSAVEEQTGMPIVFGGKDNHQHVNSHTFYMHTLDLCAVNGTSRST